MSIPRREAEALVLACTPLAWDIARRYWRQTGRRGDLEDYYAAAVLGLWEAVGRWDRSRGAAFATYGYSWARMRCRLHARQEVAAGQHVPEHHGFVRVRSAQLSAFEGNDNRPLPVPAREYEGPPDHAGVWRAADRCLPCKRQRLVVWLHYRCGWADSEIAREMNVTRSYIQQVRTAALKALRRHARRIAAAADFIPLPHEVPA